MESRESEIFMKELEKFKMELLHNELTQTTISRYMTDIKQFVQKMDIKSIDDIFNKFNLYILFNSTGMKLDTL